MRYFPFLLLFIGGSILTVGDLLMKKWISDNDNRVFILGLIIYLVGLIFMAFSFRYKNIAVASTIFVIFNILTLSLVSWIYFKETLTTYQMIGIFFGFLSILFLELA